jgi:hypothetical protein
MFFKRFDLKVLVAFFLLLAVGSLSFDILAQQRKTRKQRRNSTASTAPRPASETTDPQIVGSSASSQSTQPANTTQQNADALRETVDRLSSQITVLTEKLNQVQNKERSTFDLDRLSRAEQRADSLRMQLSQVIEREANLRMRIEQINFEMLPDNIERRSALNGSLRPELVREQTRRQLEIEKQSVQAQLDNAVITRTQLENSIASIDIEIHQIRARLGETTPNITATIPTTGAMTTSPTTSTTGTTTTTIGTGTDMTSPPTVTPTPTPYGPPQ